MYAILKSGGRQYEVRQGQVVKVEKLPGEVGDGVTLGEVLLFADGEDIQVGQPVLPEVVVEGKIIEQGRSRKLVVFKHKRRKDYSKKQGHRQFYTAIRVDAIVRRGQQAPEENAAEA
jgi:large subunit ribosomal protein L21